MTTVALLNAWGTTWAAFMLRSLVEASALLAVLLLVWLPLRRRMSTHLAYGLFLLVLVKAVVSVPLSLPAAWAGITPRLGIEIERLWGENGFRAAKPEPVAQVTVARANHAADALVPAPGPREVDPPARLAEARRRTEFGPKAVPSRVGPQRPVLSAKALLMLAWAVLVLGLVVRFASVHVGLSRLLRDARPLDPARLPIDLGSLQRRSGLPREVPVIVTPLVAAPAVWGLMRPRVLLPPGLEEALAPGQLTWVLLHELVHIRRRDAWVVLFQRLVQIAFVFHPAVWLANRIINLQREFACDDEAVALALAGAVPRHECGAGFLAVIEWVSARRSTGSPALGLFGSQTFLQRRMMHILDTRRPLDCRLSARAALLLGVVALVALPSLRAQDKAGAPPVVKGAEAKQAVAVPGASAENSEPTTYVEAPGFTPAAGAPIWSIAYSPDGEQIATGCLGNGDGPNELRIWDLETRREVCRVGARNQSFRTVAYSPDGTMIATAGFEGEKAVARLRDASDGQIRREFHGHSSGINTLAFSPDGKLLATAGRDRTVRLWNVATGLCRRTLEGHTGEVTAVSFSTDGARVASCGQDGTARIWDVVSGEEKTLLLGHSAAIDSVAFAPDSKTVATGGQDSTVRLWDPATGALIVTLNRDRPDHVNCVAFAPDGTVLAAACNPRDDDNTRAAPGVVKLWDVATRQELASLKGHTNRVFTIAIAPDGKTLASGSTEGTFKLWDISTHRLKGTLPPAPSVVELPQVVLALAYSPDGKVLATAGEGHFIVLRDVASRATLRTLPGHDDAVSSLAFAPDGRTLASGGYDRTIKLWDVASGRMRTALRGHKNWVLSIAYSPDGKMLASGGYDRSVKLWDVTGGQEVATLEGHGASVRSVAFAPDGKTLVSGSSDRTVKLWDVAGRAEQFTLRGHKDAVRAVAFAPDGALLGSASGDRTIKLWEATGGKQRATLTGHTDIVSCLAFAPGGGTLVSGGQDSMVRLWDVATGQERFILRGHTAAVAALAFAPGGQQLATGGYDTQVKLWDAHSSSRARLAFNAHEVTSPFPFSSGGARFVVYSPDGKSLATGGADGYVRLWDAATGTPKATIGRLNNVAFCGAFSADGKRLVAGSFLFGEGAKVWDLDTGAELANLNTGRRVTWAVVFAPGGKTLATSNGDGSIKIWDSERWTLALELPRQPAMVRSLAFAPDGKTLASITVGTGQDAITLWEAGTSRIRTTLVETPSPLWQLAFAPDGKALATTCIDRSVALWDIATAARKQSIPCPSIARSIAFAPDGRRLAIGMEDGDIRFWNLDADRQEFLLHGHVKSVTDLDFAPDGQSLASAGVDGTVRVWDLPAP